MISSEKTFKRKDCLAEVQGEVQKLLEEEFIVEVPAGKVNHDTPEWYLPLQAVFTPDRTTKVRLVFDASAKGQSGKSLNDHLEKGPNYINSLPNVLMAWRFDEIAYAGDMRKMFNQVMIHQDDQVFHRFLWRSNDSEQPRVYQWMRLNFGDKPAPGAGATKTLAKASEAEYPDMCTELFGRLCEDEARVSELRVRSTPYSPQANFKPKNGILTTTTLNRQMKNLQICLVINGTKLTTRFPLRKTKSLQM